MGSGVKTYFAKLPSICLFLLALADFVARPAAASAQIVIVVPKESKIDSLSFGQIYKIFRGESIGKEEERPLQIVEFSRASDAFYKKLYDTGAYAAGKRWLQLIFSGERVLPPKSFNNVQKFIKFFSIHDNAIGFLPAAVYERTHSKAIRPVVIDGLSYAHPRYLRK